MTKIGPWTATFMVIANMVGTGVFTSLGFQVAAVPSVLPILLLWVLGGVVALAGALTYGELGTALPRSGGEYHVLRTQYHPALGFLAGWVSATVGFAAPTALAAIAFSTYAKAVVPAIPVVHTAASVVLLFTALHCVSMVWGNRFTDVLTVVKVALLVLIIGASLRVSSGASGALSVAPVAGDVTRLASPAFAVSLVYVYYAYTGWNAAIYIVGEMADPKKLPRALIGGTATVAILYTLVNYAFLHTVPMDELSGQIEVGYLSARRVFGEGGGRVMAVVIAVILTSTISVMTYVGPRIVQVMGEDVRLLRPLAKRNANGIPVHAVLAQAVLTLGFIYTATFEQVLLYAGFTLNLVTALAVASVFWLEERPRAYRTWGYPLTPVVFLGLSAWSSIYMLLERPWESLGGLLTLSAGLSLYLLDRSLARKVA